MLDNDQKSENEKNGELHRLIMMTVPTLCICLCQGLAVKWLVFVKVMGPSMTIANTCCVVLLSTGDIWPELTQSMRETTLYSGVLIYFVYVTLLNPSFLVHSVVRTVFHVVDIIISLWTI